MNLLGFFSTTAMIAVIMLVVKSVSLLRDAVIAGYFGANAEVDTFFLMMSWAYFLTSVFATSGINYIVPKIKVNMLEDPSLFKVGQSYSLMYILGLTVAAGLFVVLANISTSIALLPLVITATIFFVNSLNHYLSSLFNLKNIFSQPAALFVCPVIFTMIPLLQDSCTSTELLAYFLLGCLVQFIILVLSIPDVKQRIHRMKPRPLSKSDYIQWGVIAVATFYFPATELLSALLASYLPDGSIATLGYAMKIPQAMAYITIFAVWTVALPKMQVQQDSQQGQISRQDWVKTMVVMLGVGLMASISYVLSPLIVKIMYGHSQHLSPVELGQIVSLQQMFFAIMPVLVFVNLVFRYMHASGNAMSSIVLSAVGLSSQILCFVYLGLNLQAVAIGFGVNCFICSLLIIFQQKMSNASAEA